MQETKIETITAKTGVTFNLSTKMVRILTQLYHQSQQHITLEYTAHPVHIQMAF